MIRRYQTSLGFALMGLALLPAAGAAQVHLNLLSQYNTGLGSGGAEISTYDPGSRRLFTCNGVNNTMDIVDLANPAAPLFVARINLNPYGGSINSVAVYNGVVATAIQAVTPQNPGVAAFFDVNGAFLNQVTVGALPDMITFTPNGQRVLVANEGEPNNAYTVDPVGSVSIIDLSGGVAAATVTTVGFTDFNVGGPRAAELPAGVRIYGPGASVAQDLEPEYIAVSADNATAWVSLQEANALAVIDIAGASVVRIDALGLKNHSLPGRGLDPSDQDGGIHIANWPVSGIYEPDGVAVHTVAGTPYVISANEGDTRAYAGLNEEVRVSSGSYALDATIFPNAATLKQNANLGRLTVTNRSGNLDADAQFERIEVPGARSFSIWNGLTGAQVYDSGDDFEQKTATLSPTLFNSQGDVATFDSRSDNKGPEPEGVDVGTLFGRTYAFVGLERIGGVFVYEITNPAAPSFVLYEPNASLANSPEGVHFVPAAEGPGGKALLLLANEVSGTVSVYEVAATDPTAVTLARFEATNSADGVTIAWATAAEHEHAYFDILRRDEPTAAWMRQNAAPITGGERYTFLDRTAPESATVGYRLESVDRQGRREVAGELSVTVDRRATQFGLALAGANPFRTHTAFQLDLDRAGRGDVRLFDAAGRLVRDLSTGPLPAGRHTLEWDGRDATGAEAPAGVYFARAASGDRTGVVRVLKTR